ncbi:MAG: hypothetical protein OCD02_19765 [Spirochaetaceae bacterium]
MFIDYLLEHKDLLILLTSITIITFVGSLILIPLIIINLSPDYFSEKGHSLYEYKHPIIRYTVLIVKNIFGYILLVLGFIMLFIPGQGLLSITLGIFFINFPGKKKLEYKVLSNKKVSSVINSIRRKAGKDEINFIK